MADTADIEDAPCIRTVERCYCGAKVAPLVSGPFYVRWHDGAVRNLRTILYYCRRCDLTIRGLDYCDPLAQTHYELASYTDLAKEEKNKRKRERFFSWLCDLAAAHLGRRPKKVLDFGCSYGHLLDFFDRDEVETIGIDVAPQIVEKLRGEGRHHVYLSIDDPAIVPGSIDVIFAIDSLYCLETDPATLLARLAQKLRPGGLLITRTTNRNLVHRILACWWRLRRGQPGEAAPISYKICGDGKLGFSQRALQLHAARAELEQVAAYRWEYKSNTALVTIRDLTALLLYYGSLGRFDVCSGLVLVACRRPQATGEGE